MSHPPASVFASVVSPPLDYTLSEYRNFVCPIQCGNHRTYIHCAFHVIKSQKKKVYLDELDWSNTLKTHFHTYTGNGLFPPLPFLLALSRGWSDKGGLQRDYSSHDSVEPCRGKVGGLRSVLVLTPAQLASSQERLALQFCVQWHHTDSLGVKGENKFTKFWGNCLKVRRIIEISGGRNDPLMLGPFLYRGCERP